MNETWHLFNVCSELWSWKRQTNGKIPKAVPHSCIQSRNTWCLHCLRFLFFSFIRWKLYCKPFCVCVCVCVYTYMYDFFSSWINASLRRSCCVHITQKEKYCSQNDSLLSIQASTVVHLWHTDTNYEIEIANQQQTMLERKIARLVDQCVVEYIDETDKSILVSWS